MPGLKPLPCPACEDHAVQVGVIEDDRNPCVYFSVMCLCGVHGPEETTEAKAITAWNSLPRALTWTTEPPRVEGNPNE